MSASETGARYELGVDIGGTFTDVVLRDTSSGQVFVGKTLTTPQDPAQGALEGVRRLIKSSGVAASAIIRAVHGTTLVTNTIIERKGARTAYATTAGFADVFEVGRQKRYDMYDLAIRFPEPLVPRPLRFELNERVDAAGQVRTALDPEEVRVLTGQLREAGVEAVAVCFLHSYRRPEHERLVARVLAEAAPELDISISADVAPEIREYPRATTTAANAYVAKATRGYLARLQAGLRAIGCPARLHVMLSHGGLATAATASLFPIRLLESGPAGGALVAAYHAALIGNTAEQDQPVASVTAAGRQPPDNAIALAFDMGGTTAKVCLLQDGAPRITNRFEAARVHRLKRGSGLPIAVPCVDLIEIGAGGGSIARVDGLGLLRVGPDSAGAEPGPACYGRGGRAPTVTDADLVLGYLDPASFLGGAMPLDEPAAHVALRDAVAQPLKAKMLDAAWAVHSTVNAQMADAVRVHAAERGVDVRTLDMIAFGGAGPVHAERLARSLRLRRVVVPYASGAASGIGFLVAPLSFDFATSNPQRLDALDPSVLASLYAELRQAGRDLLAEAGVPEGEATFEYSCDMRYSGQGYEIAVPLGQSEPWRLDQTQLVQRFEEVYHALYGRIHEGAPVEAVTWRLVARGPRPDVTLRYAGTVDAGAGAATGPSDPVTPAAARSFVAEAAAMPAAGADGADAPPAHLEGSRPPPWRRLSRDDLRARALRGSRLAYTPESGRMVPFDVYDRRRLCPGDRFGGPALVEEPESTAVLGPGSIASVDEHLNLIIVPPAAPDALPSRREAGAAHDLRAGHALARQNGTPRALQEQLA